MLPAPLRPARLTTKCPPQVPVYITYALHNISLRSVRVGVEMNDRFPTWFSFDAELLRGLLPGPDAQVVVAGPLSPKWANSPVRPW